MRKYCSRYCMKRACQLRYRALHAQDVALNHRKGSLRKSFGMSIEQYNDMFSTQAGRCAICGKHQSEMKSRIAVDHDHATGKVRQLLCTWCNARLATIENRAFHDKAEAYLARHASIKLAEAAN